MTRLVHWQEEPFDVRIMRPSKWGNRFEVGRHGTRRQCMVKYAKWILFQDELLNAIPIELKDRTIACCCTGVKERCHGEILVKIAEEGIEWLITWQLTLLNSRDEYENLIAMLDGSTCMSVAVNNF